MKVRSISYITEHVGIILDIENRFSITSDTWQCGYCTSNHHNIGRIDSTIDLYQKSEGVLLKV